MKTPNYKTALWFILGAPLALVVLIGIWGLRFGLAAKLGVDKDAFRLEFFKSFWDFLLVVVLGGAVGLYFKNREEETTTTRQKEDRDREQRDARRESLLRTRADLVKAYNQAKAVRRLLRGLAFCQVNEQDFVRRDEYNCLMRKLIKAQLEFEYYRELIESDEDRYPKSALLTTQIRIIETYLNKIVDEFEGAWEVFAGNEQAPLDNSKFKRLREFVEQLGEKSGKKPEEDPSFKKDFNTPFHKALKLIESTADEPGDHGNR